MKYVIIQCPKCKDSLETIYAQEHDNGITIDVNTFCSCNREIFEQVEDLMYKNKQLGEELEELHQEVNKYKEYGI